LAAILAPCAALALMPAVAQAADVSVEGGTLRYTSGASANSVHVAPGTPGRLQVTDPKTSVHAGSGCTSSGQHSASCSAAGVTAISIDLGGGADRASIAPAISIPARIAGGGGADVLLGGSGADRLEGGPGPDNLDGAAGNDTELGGDGNDTFSQGRSANGADSLTGGGGVDRVGYGRRSGRLAVSLDGVANDGDAAPAEGDNVGTDVEDVSGGSGPDTIVGDGARNALDGGAGNDFVDGRAGVDALEGGPGADFIGSRDLSADGVSCGSAADRVRGNPSDHFGGDCEVVRTGAPIRVRPLSRHLAGGRTVRLKVTCDKTAFGPCAGRVFVATVHRVHTKSGVRRVSVGSRAFRLDPGTSKEVRVRAHRGARRLVRRHSRLVRARVLGGDSAGPAVRVARAFVLRR